MISTLIALLLAADRPVIDLSGGRVQAYPLAMARPLGTQETGVAVQSVLGQDFERSGLFKLLDPASFLAPPTEGLTGIDFRTNTLAIVLYFALAIAAATAVALLLYRFLDPRAR